MNGTQYTQKIVDKNSTLFADSTKNISIKPDTLKSLITKAFDKGYIEGKSIIKKEDEFKESFNNMFGGGLFE